MNLRERFTTAVHGVLCGTGKVPQVSDGCCGCGAPEMDAYVTVGCTGCDATGEGYCWTCIDGPGWYDHITPASFTAMPGRERAS